MAKHALIAAVRSGKSTTLWTRIAARGDRRRLDEAAALTVAPCRPDFGDP